MILIVDDSVSMLERVAMDVEVQGFRVLTAKNGAEAVELLNSHDDIHAIVADIVMPLMDGFALAKHVATIQNRPYFFLMTANDVDMDWNSLAAGIDGLFFKPFEAARFSTKLKAVEAEKKRKA